MRNFGLFAIAATSIGLLGVPGPRTAEAAPYIATPVAPALVAGPDRVKAALGTAFMGITCSNCGSDKVIRAGACGVCTQCGTSQGCS